MRQKKPLSAPNPLLSNKTKRENPFKKPTSQGDATKGLASLSKRPILKKNISKQTLPESVKVLQMST